MESMIVQILAVHEAKIGIITFLFISGESCKCCIKSNQLLFFLFAGNRLYFCESHQTNFVDSVTVDGSDRIRHFFNAAGKYRFFGIALDAKYIYLTSWLQRLVDISSSPFLNSAMCNLFFYLL